MLLEESSTIPCKYTKIKRHKYASETKQGVGDDHKSIAGLPLTTTVFTGEL